MSALIFVLVVPCLFLFLGYLAACSGAYRWLSLSEWLGKARCRHEFHFFFFLETFMATKLSSVDGRDQYGSAINAENKSTDQNFMTKGTSHDQA